MVAIGKVPGDFVDGLTACCGIWYPGCLDAGLLRFGSNCQKIITVSDSTAMKILLPLGWTHGFEVGTCLPERLLIAKHKLYLNCIAGYIPTYLSSNCGCHSPVCFACRVLVLTPVLLIDRQFCKRRHVSPSFASFRPSSAHWLTSLLYSNLSINPGLKVQPGAPYQAVINEGFKNKLKMLF